MKFKTSVKNIKKHKVSAVALAAAAGIILSAAAPGEAFAAAKPSLIEYSEEEMALLADNTLEYWEIPGLIQNYNVTFLNQLETFYSDPDGSGMSRDQLLSFAADLRDEAARMERDAEDMKDDGDITNEEYKEYKEGVSQLKTYAKELEDSADGKSASGLAALRELRILREQQTVSAQAKMKNYQKLADQEEIAEKNLELAQLTYDSAVLQQSIGLYSNEDVLSAYEALQTANGNYLSAKASCDSAKQDLLTMLGWKYDDDPEIMRIPDPDVNEISQIDLKADTELAIQNNYTLHDDRTTSSLDQGGANQKARNIKDDETLVKKDLETLYNNLLQQQATYEAAMDAYAIAENAKATADRQYSLGLISQKEYLSAEVTYLSAVASKDSASMDLLDAMETYDWAVWGLMELS